MQNFLLLWMPIKFVWIQYVLFCLQNSDVDAYVRLCTSSRMVPMGQPTPAADISWMGSVDFVFCYCQVQMGVESTMCGVNQSVHFFFVLKKSSEELIFFLLLS
jgi:hypothetical protein